jgi:pimeloyl-ACP methyl ester carboxylesterase
MRKGMKLKPSKHMILVQGAPVYYEVVGEGNPVILVHGLSGSTLWWVRNIQTLAQHHKVYLLDLPSFGTMNRAHPRFALSAAGSWLIAWMQAIGLQQADFIGHSMGGFICLWIAAHQPYRVSRLVLVSPAIFPQPHSLMSYFVPLLKGVRELTPLFFPILLYDALRAGPFTLLRAASELIREDPQDEIKAVEAPTLLIWGENDTLVPASMGQALRQTMKHARLHIINHAGHVSMFDRPQAFNTAVEAYLAGQSVGE